MGLFTGYKLYVYIGNEVYDSTCAFEIEDLSAWSSMQLGLVVKYEPVTECATVYSTMHFTIQVSHTYVYMRK